LAKARSLRKDNVGYLFIAPYFFFYLLLGVYPLIHTFWLTFQKFDGFKPATWAGLANWARIFDFGNKEVFDPMFWKSIANTWIIWGMNFIPQLLLALLLAVILANDKLKGGGAFRAIYYLPNLVTAASVGTLFQVLLGWQEGTVNKILVGLNVIDAAHKINFFGSELYMRMAIAFIQFWMWFGNSSLLIMAGIKAIPGDLYEAAVVDGANGWQKFTKITLPLIRPTMTYIMVTSLIGGMQIFDIPKTIMFNSDGPNHSNLTSIFYMYNQAFQYRNYSYGATVAYGLFIEIVLFSIIFYRVTYGSQLKK
jgi:multiple sugar transport system permease protein